MPCQREDRQEGDGDDQQAEEQRRANLGRGFDQHFHPWLAGFRPFQMLVGVFNHHDGGVDHRANGDSDAAKAHDIGPDAKRAHGGEGHQEAHRQHDDGDQRRADMQQEDKCDQRHDDAFLRKRRP